LRICPEIHIRSGSLDYQESIECVSSNSKPASDSGRLFILQKMKLASLSLGELLDIPGILVHEFSLTSGKCPHRSVADIVVGVIHAPSSYSGDGIGNTSQKRPFLRHIPDSRNTPVPDGCWVVSKLIS
jgi:hypothetical protein